MVTASALSIPRLRTDVIGRVAVPGDADYDDTRRVYYGKFDAQPMAIVRAADETDVARVVSLARETGVELAVRSGGHSVAGHSTTDGGILLDLRGMKALNIDIHNRTAWAQTGLTAGEYTVAAGEHGLTTGFGDAGSVGIGGITLGGGIGYLVRKHGLTIDDLLAADVVTADGEVRHVDAESYPDLFWAIRGGGGNFGVVTRFKFRLQPVDTIVGGLLVLPATPEVIASFIAEAGAAPDELSTIANVMVAPPAPFLPVEAHGQLVLLAMICYAGPAEAADRALAPLRALATPIADVIRPMPYPELYQMAEGGHAPSQATSRTLFTDTFDSGDAQAIIDHLRNATAPFAVAQLRALGGAMARVPVEATAFAHRQRKVMVAIAALYSDAAETPFHDAWAEGLAGALAHGDTGRYVNFLGIEGEDRVRDAYPGATWDRLVEIKSRYDSTNLFRRNHNIPPIVAR